jgi:hypothetical protein
VWRFFLAREKSKPLRIPLQLHTKIGRLNVTEKTSFYRLLRFHVLSEDNRGVKRRSFP